MKREACTFIFPRPPRLQADKITNWTISDEKSSSYLTKILQDLISDKFKGAKHRSNNKDQAVHER